MGTVTIPGGKDAGGSAVGRVKLENGKKLRPSSMLSASVKSAVLRSLGSGPGGLSLAELSRTGQTYSGRGGRQMVEL